MALPVDPRDSVSDRRHPRDGDESGPSSRRSSVKAGGTQHYAWWCAVAVFGALLLSFPLDGPTRALIELFTPARSEYRVYEQLTKLYLLVCILVAAAQLTLTRRAGAPFWERVTPASLLVFSTAIYLAESNMISEAAQPLAGLLFGGTAAAGLVRLRRWAALAWITVAGGLLAGAVIIDELSHLRPAIDREPLRDAILWLVRAEERWDVVAMSTLALVTLLACRDGVLDAFRRLTPRWAAIALVGTALVTTSNGMMHWEYEPRRTLYIAAIPTAFAGMAMLRAVNLRLARTSGPVEFGTAGAAGMSFFMVGLCIILPVTFGTVSTSTSLMMWVPVLTMALPVLVRLDPDSGHKSALR